MLVLWFKIIIHYDFNFVFIASNLQNFDNYCLRSHREKNRIASTSCYELLTSFSSKLYRYFQACCGSLKCDRMEKADCHYTAANGNTTSLTSNFHILSSPPFFSPHVVGSACTDAHTWHVVVQTLLFGYMYVPMCANMWCSATQTKFFCLRWC